MSYKLTSITSAIHRTTGLIQGNAASYSCFFWFRPDVNIGIGTGNTVYERINAAATAWTGIFGSNPDQYNLDVSNGGVDLGTAANTLVAGKWYPLYYAKSGNNHSFGISTLFKGTVVVDISAIVFSDMILGYDGFAGTEGNGTYQCFREWTAVLAPSDFQLEANSRTAVRTANLVTDCPLINNLLDLTANHNDFTAIGTGTFVSDDPIPAGCVVTDPIVIGSLPYSNSIAVQPSNVEFVFNQWIKYTPVANEIYIGGWLFGALANYRVNVNIYSDAGVTSYPPHNPISTINKRFQMPTTPGHAYYFSAFPVVLSTALDSGINLTVDFQTGPNKTVADGSLFINDDLQDFFAATVSNVPADNYNVLKFIPFAITTSENGGDISPVSGKILVIDDVTAKILMYSPQLVQLLNTGITGTTNGVVRRLASGVAFYTAFNLTVNRVNQNGVVFGTTWILAGTRITALAPSNDETILYVNPSTATGAPIKKWDLVNSVFLGDLVAGIANYFVIDLMVLADNSILAMYYKSSVTRNIKVIRYDATGAILNTFDFGAPVTLPPSGGSIAFDFADPANYFEVRLHHFAFDGSSTLRRVKIIDGTFTGVDHVIYEGGVYAAAETTTPIAKFGISSSCPFFPIRALTQFGGIYKIQKDKRNDTLWLDVNAQTTEDVKIPDPLFRTALIGD